MNIQKMNKDLEEIIESTEYNGLVWFYDDGIYTTTNGDFSLTLIDNRDVCERCGQSIEDVDEDEGCEQSTNHVFGSVILDGQFCKSSVSYSMLDENLLNQLADVVIGNRHTKKEKEQPKVIDHESILKMFV